jgi:hypothetical protein
MGWHSRPAMTYTGKYFANYQELDATPMGGLLTQARIDLVEKFYPVGVIVDIGIGGGRFVEDGGAMGYDVCEDAVKWLQDTGRFVDPYAAPVEAITCWDSLEHIPEPEKLLAQVKTWFFVALPLCESADEWMSSKHYKPGEHLHYWSLPGFIDWCEAQGFQVMEVNHAETELGREGITSFAFKRVS